MHHVCAGMEEIGANGVPQWGPGDDDAFSGDELEEETSDGEDVS